MTAPEIEQTGVATTPAALAMNHTLPALAPASPATRLQVNPDLLRDDDAPTGPDGLPAGVVLEDQPLPEGRVELFRVNGRVYTVPAVADPRIMFRYMRATRKGNAESAMSEMLYGVLGDAIIDVLADEELAPDELQAVMKAVQKYTMSAANRAGLGNS